MLTFLATLFALGTIGFWLLVFIDFVIVTALVEHEEGVWATVVALASIVGLNYLWKLPVISAIKDNPGHTALLVGSYFALGAGWSIFKWYTYLHKQNRKYESFKADFLAAKHLPGVTLTPIIAAELMDKIENQNRYQHDEGDKISTTPPLARNHVVALTRWATYWPFSMVGFALNDIVRKTWTYIIDLLQNTYQRISNYVFRSASADTALAAQYKAEQAALAAEKTAGRNRG